MTSTDVRPERQSQYEAELGFPAGFTFGAATASYQYPPSVSVSTVIPWYVSW